MDACKYAIGAGMEHEYDEWRNTVAFISRTLNQHEQNYAAQHLELFENMDIFRMWSCYLYRQKFFIHTDHHPVKYLETQ